MKACNAESVIAMTLKSSRHGGNVFAFSRARRNAILDFSININPLGLSPLGRKALKRYWEIETLRYPDVESRDVTAALSRSYGMEEECITLGNGATELMYTLLRIAMPDKVLIPAPSFSEYRLSAESAGCTVETFLLNHEAGFPLPLEKIRKAMAPHSLVYLGNPNNPDGRLLKREDFNAVMDMAEGSLVVIDESFIDFVGDGFSYRKLVNSYPNLVIIMSLTKFYAVPGLRIGCAFSTPATAANLKKQLIPWNVNGPAQLYMAEAAGDKEYISRTKHFVSKERSFLQGELSSFPGLAVYPGTVNFLLLKLTGKNRDVSLLADDLLEEGILIRQCDNYEGLDQSFFRIAVRSREENEKLLNALRKVWRR